MTNDLRLNMSMFLLFLRAEMTAYGIALFVKMSMSFDDRSYFLLIFFSELQTECLYIFFLSFLILFLQSEMCSMKGEDMV